MLDAGGGGGGAGTAWSGMTLDDMQKLIQNPNVEKHWELLTGWRRSADLVNEHRAQVQSYRDNLAAVWPPEKSPAAAAYLARLDDLIANLTETYEAAVANHTAFSTATLSISLAQKDMDEIYREYSSNAQLMAAHNSAQQERNNGTPSPSPAPSGGEQPPVAPGRQDELRWKAVALLSSVSSELASAQVQIVKPKPYPPATTFGDDPTPLDGTPYIAPPIPPLTPAVAGRSTTPTTPTPQRSSVVFPAPNGTTPPVNAAPPPGLVLGGTTPITTPPATGIPPIQSAPANSLPSPSVQPGIMPPGTKNFVPGGGTIAHPVGVGPGRGLSVPREGLAHPQIPAGIRSMPPGGLIGGVPGVGVSQPARTATQHVNPVGGVISGNQPQSRLSASRAAEGSNGATYGPNAGRRGGHDDQAERMRWDPNNPWEIAEGVDPVVLPSREQRIDPGPAIGLR